MNNADIITMLGNLSQSLFPVQHLISGGAYIIGIVFFIVALQKLKKIGDSRVSGGGHERMMVPVAYILAGAALVFLPTAISTLSATAFGVGNILEYTRYNRFDIYSTMGMIIRTAGLIWFVRGAVLLAHASQPGVQEGPKGLVFLIAGVMAINFDNTVAMFNAMLHYVTTMTLAVGNII